MTEQPVYPEIRNPVKAIRAFCTQCIGSVYNIPDCPSKHTCPLYPYRMGRNPFRTEWTEEQRAIARERMKPLLEKQKAERERKTGILSDTESSS